MITVANRVGKLCEVRIQSPVTSVEIMEMSRQIFEIVKKCGTIRGVTDLRSATVFPTELAEQIVTFLRQDSPSIERGAFILGDSAVFALQLDRVLRDSKTDKRRFFRDRRLLSAWLGEVLTPPEAERLSAFLTEGDAAQLTPPSSPAPSSWASPSSQVSYGPAGPTSTRRR
jgi:hypothetical protein